MPKRSEKLTRNRWVVQTKLQPPRLRDDLIPRPHLLEALRQAVAACRLTIISAPAGYGKTTLLARLGLNDPRLKVAWLSLDQEDNDPSSFLNALIAALQRLQPNCGATAQTVLDSLINPAEEARRVMGVLINDILETLPNPFLLILDDLHLIETPAIYEALDYLLERMPDQMRLVIGTRHTPPLALARLRSQEGLAELRLEQLRFTLDETSLLLNERLRLNLSADDLSHLYARTEGWAAGLRLLANSLEQRLPFVERTILIRELTGSSRHIFDLLAEEVLNRQEPEIRRFLLETSLLGDLTPTQCQAITGRTDAGAILEKLYHQNLFMVAIDEKFVPCPPIIKPTGITLFSPIFYGSAWRKSCQSSSLNSIAGRPGFNLLRPERSATIWLPNSGLKLPN